MTEALSHTLIEDSHTLKMICSHILVKGSVHVRALMVSEIVTVVE